MQVLWCLEELSKNLRTAEDSDPRSAAYDCEKYAFWLEKRGHRNYAEKLRDLGKALRDLRVQERAKLADMAKQVDDLRKTLQAAGIEEL